MFDPAAGILAGLSNGVAAVENLGTVYDCSAVRRVNTNW